MRVVFVGTGAIGVPSLEALADCGHELAGVITQPDRPAGRRMELMPPPVKVAAARRGLRVEQPERINQEGALVQLRALAPDVLVVCAYGQILRSAVLGLPKLGCLNLHASLLPRHRGASCIQAAILAGDAMTGMTLMWMNEGLDTGDIMLMRETPIGEEETAGELHDRLAVLGAPLLLEGLKLLAEGRAPRIPQEHARATYAPKLDKSSGVIDWSRPAVEIGRLVRAMHPWPGAQTWVEVEGRRRLLKVHQVAVIADGAAGRPGRLAAVSEGGVVVESGEGKVVLQEIQIEGRARMKASACLRGLRAEVGWCLG